MLYFFLIVVLISSKVFNNASFYNIAFIPFLLFVYCSPSSISTNKKSSFITLISLTLLIFACLYLNSGSSGLPTLLRSLSLSSFLLALFGQLPFNPSLFISFRLPILFSIPALLFLSDPIWIYSYPDSQSSFVSSMGFWGGYTLAGLFPTSFYFAQILTAVLIFQLSPIFSFYRFKLYPKIKLKYDRVISLILLTFTNRKAFLVVLFMYPLSMLINLISDLFRTTKVNKNVLSNITLSSIIIAIVFYIISAGLSFDESQIGFGLLRFYEQSLTRLAIYFNWIINPIIFVQETGGLWIFKYGGFILYYFTLLAFLSSLSISLINFKIRNLSAIIVAQSIAALALFKEAATIFSPSPSSLMLLMVISMLNYSVRKKDFDPKKDLAI